MSRERRSVRVDCRFGRAVSSETVRRLAVDRSPDILGVELTSVFVGHARDFHRDFFRLRRNVIGVPASLVQALGRHSDSQRHRVRRRVGLPQQTGEFVLAAVGVAPRQLPHFGVRLLSKAGLATRHLTLAFRRRSRLSRCNAERICTSHFTTLKQPQLCDSRKNAGGSLHRACKDFDLTRGRR